MKDVRDEIIHLSHNAGESRREENFVILYLLVLITKIFHQLFYHEGIIQL